MQIIQKRKIYYIISLFLIIPGIISLFTQGLNLGIDFEGGSILHVRINAETTVNELRESISGLEYGNPEVQKSNDEFYIRTIELDQEQTKELLQLLTARFQEVEFLSSESVGAVIGSELTRNALLSVCIAALLMLAYITVRFEWSFGVAAVLAIIHNVLIVVGAFSIFQWQINSAFIAAILTVVGYTINDTIVIFDRVRENMRLRKKEDYMSLLNRSILQSFNRSINTVFTSAFALIALLLLGGETIKFFIAAMLIGFVVGAYSSIFIASPLWYELKTRV